MTPIYSPPSSAQISAVLFSRRSAVERDNPHDMDEPASTRAEANAQLRRLREAIGIKGDYNDSSDNKLVSCLDEALDL